MNRRTWIKTVLADEVELNNFLRHEIPEEWDLWLGSSVVRAVYRDPCEGGVAGW